MSAASGQYGTVHVGSSEILEVSEWTFQKKANVHEYATNATAGHKKTVSGTKSGSGSLKGVLDPGDRITDHINEGDTVTLKLYDTAAAFYTVPATIENIDTSADIEEGSPVPWSASFKADGAWTNPSST